MAELDRWGQAGEQLAVQAPSEERERSGAERRLQALRQLLRRDVLSHADWEGALVDSARMTRQALAADAGLIALWDDDDGWSAWTDEGRQVQDAAIRLVASRSVLESVRGSGQPLVGRERLPQLGRSASATRHDLGFVLAIPLRWWDPGEGRPTQRFAGCLYADRRGESSAFAEDDVELLIDLAATVERTLGLLRHVARLSDSAAAWREQATALQGEVTGRRLADAMASLDPQYRAQVLAPLERAARVDRVGILLVGPTGSGKTHLAYAYHAASRRRRGPFVVLDCGQVTSSEALAAELFGYAKRSGFAAPPEGRPGKARLASGGTLFLDEIGSLPLELQQRLLRLIQTGRYAPLGEAEEQQVDLQILAAANHDLTALVREGRFREDLYWRLAEMVLRIPPLDRRPADIPALAHRFLAAAAERFDRPEIASFSPAALADLQGFAWSSAGNIRGLEQTVHRSVLLAPPGVRRLEPEQLSFVATLTGGQAALRTAPALPPPRVLTVDPAVAPAARSLDRDGLTALLMDRLAAHRGNLAAVATDPAVVAALAPGALTVAPSTLRLRLRQLGLADSLAEARQPMPLDALARALREHGDGNRAAAALGLTRDQLVWQLRRRGLSIRELLAQGPERQP